MQQEATRVASDEMAQRLKVLSNATRLRVFDLLMQGMQCNCELGNALDLAPNLISHHLGVLRRAGLITVERDPNDARWIYYAVKPDALASLHQSLSWYFDPARIKPRDPKCGPRGRYL